MATIHSSDKGQVVEARDDYGRYYYIADGLGTPTAGVWDTEEDALAALEGGGPEPAAEMNERGERLHYCAYCGRDVTANAVPPADDDDAWAELAKMHGDGCYWIETRAHRRDPLD